MPSPSAFRTVHALAIAQSMATEAATCGEVKGAKDSCLVSRTEWATCLLWRVRSAQVGCVCHCGRAGVHGEVGTLGGHKRGTRAVWTGKVQAQSWRSGPHSSKLAARCLPDALWWFQSAPASLWPPPSQLLPLLHSRRAGSGSQRHDHSASRETMTHGRGANLDGRGGCGVSRRGSRGACKQLGAVLR